MIFAPRKTIAPLVTFFPSFTKSVNTLEFKEEQRGVMIYPKPAKEDLMTHNYSEPGTINFYDLSGRLVRTFCVGVNTLKQIPFGNLRNGLYLIRIENKKE